MLKYITKRLLTGLVSLIILIAIVFFLTRLMPGNPFDLANVTDEMQAKVTAYYGLDKPVTTQFISYMSKLLHGDMGESYRRPGITVVQLIKQEAPYTIKLGLISYAVALVLGTIIGIIMASTKKEWLKSSMTVITVMGISIPNYVLSLVLLLFLGAKLNILPVIGLSSWKHYIMPVTALSVYPLAQITKLVRSSYSEAMKQDYVTMARAKGLNPGRISFIHVLKNAMIPVVTISGPTVAFLLTGSFVVETIFTIPGIGREFVNCISNRDYTVIMGLTIFLGAILVICNLVSDIVCAVVDPRIKLEKRG